jgi:hypothetical protein
MVKQLLQELAAKTWVVKWRCRRLSGIHDEGRFERVPGFKVAIYPLVYGFYHAFILAACL